MKINHLTFSVSNLENSIFFYENALGATLLVKGERTAYFDLSGGWLALNVEENIPREEIHRSYTHIAFTAQEDEFDSLVQRLEDLQVNILRGRGRAEQEAKSVYFTDPDGHKFEFHTGTREQRIQYYKDEKKNMLFYT